MVSMGEVVVEMFENYSGSRQIKSDLNDIRMDMDDLRDSFTSLSERLDECRTRLAKLRP